MNGYRQAPARLGRTRVACLIPAPISPRWVAGIARGLAWGALFAIPAELARYAFLTLTAH